MEALKGSEEAEREKELASYFPVLSVSLWQYLDTSSISLAVFPHVPAESFCFPSTKLPSLVNRQAATPPQSFQVLVNPSLPLCFPRSRVLAAS